MALTAAVAAALAAWFASVVVGLAGSGPWRPPPLLYALALAPGVAVAVRRGGRALARADRWVRLAIMVAALAALALFVTTAFRPVEPAQVAWVGLAAVVPLSWLWPDRRFVRAAVVLSAASLVGAGPSWVEALVPLAGQLVSSAVALVASSRLLGEGVLTLGESPPADRRRRAGREALLVGAVVIALAALIASVVPVPSRGQPRGGEPADPQAAAGSLNPLAGSGLLDIAEPRGPLDDGVVLRVSAPAPDLWRAISLDDFDGRVWRSRAETLVAIPVGGRYFVAARSTQGQSVTERFAQRFTVEAPYASVLPGVFQPTYVDVAGTEVRSGLASSVIASPPVGKGASYLVESDRPVGPPGGAAGPDGPASPGPARPGVRNPYQEVVERLYLGLPAVSARVRSVAADLVEGAATPYAAALAVEEWLQDNTGAVKEADAVAPGIDPVDAAVFGGAGATPERLASAMIVMLRAEGIPARLVVGFLPGDRSAFSGDFTVHADDVHAWVEAWTGPPGWYRFDPTGLAPAVGLQESPWLAPLRRLVGSLWPLLAAALAVALAAGLAYWLWRRSRRRRQSSPVEPTWAAACFASLARAGADLDRPRRPPETPAEYARVLAGVVADDRLHSVGRVLTKEAWSEGSGRELSAAERAARGEVDATVAALLATAAAEKEQRRRNRRRTRRRFGRGGRDRARSSRAPHSAG